MKQHTTWVALGLGTNIEDRMAFLEDAAFKLQPLISGMVHSAIYENPAMLPEGAPSEWNKPFLNMAIGGNTRLSARELLGEIKTLEQKLGRKPRRPWGPREIDIDILAYGEEVIDDAELKTPHPGLLKRNFALKPLADIAPDWRFPYGEHAGKTAAELVELLGYNADIDLRRYDN